MKYASTQISKVKVMSYSFDISQLENLGLDMHRIQPLLLLVLTLFPTLSWSDEITFGVVPQQSAKKLAAKWEPIFLGISEKTRHNIHFSTAKDIPTFEKRLLDGDYDLAYMNPYHYTAFSQKLGYQAFAEQTDKKIKGIVVVHKDSELKDLTEGSDWDDVRSLELSLLNSLLD